jgi:hypothetical protein
MNRVERILGIFAIMFIVVIIIGVIALRAGFASWLIRQIF